VGYGQGADPLPHELCEACLMVGRSLLNALTWWIFPEVYLPGREVYPAGVKRCTSTSTSGRPNLGLDGSSIVAVGTYFYPVERDSPATGGGWGGVVFWGKHVTLANAYSLAVTSR